MLNFIFLPYSAALNGLNLEENYQFWLITFLSLK